jgi:iron complex transport system permease protein
VSRSVLRPAAILAGLAVLLGAVVLTSVKLGQVSTSWADLWRALSSSGSLPDADGSRRILLELRLPRVFLGVVVGAALASSGTVFQAILRNPLADPYLLGLSGGAALGAVLVLLTGAGQAAPLLVPAAAFAGALLAVLAVHRIATSAGALPPTALILAGVVVSAFCSAFVMFLTAVSPSARVHGALFWMMGSLASPQAGILSAAALAVAGGVVVLCACGGELNALSMGEDVAGQLGVEVGRVRSRLFLAASLVTGAAVSASGLIGFVGLVVPHALRALVGADHRLLVPASALAGAAVLVLADTAARTIMPPTEIPVGVITALFGAPFFLVLLNRRRGWMS